MGCIGVAAGSQLLNVPAKKTASAPFGRQVKTVGLRSLLGCGFGFAILEFPSCVGLTGGIL
jgi:hypothetical protein